MRLSKRQKYVENLRHGQNANTAFVLDDAFDHWQKILAYVSSFTFCFQNLSSFFDQVCVLTLRSVCDSFIANGLHAANKSNQQFLVLQTSTRIVAENTLLVAFCIRWVQFFALYLNSSLMLVLTEPSV